MKREGKVPTAEAKLPVGEFGQVTEWIPRSHIHVLPQIRTVFNEDALIDLAGSIRLIEEESKENSPRYDLLEPLTEGCHDEASARRYLAQYNQVNGTDLMIEQYEPTVVNGRRRWIFHIAGERRYRATGLIIERDGLSSDSLVQCSVKYNIEYINALPLQFIENNARVNPTPQDEATAIRKYSDAMKDLAESRGERFTNVMCAKAFAVHPDKITDAMTFTDYPKEMKDLVDSGKYSFSTIVAAKKLYEAWCEYHRGSVRDEIADAVVAALSKSGLLDLVDLKPALARLKEHIDTNLNIDMMAEGVVICPYDLAVAAGWVELIEAAIDDQYSDAIESDGQAPETDDFDSEQPYVRFMPPSKLALAQSAVADQLADLLRMDEQPELTSETLMNSMRGVDAARVVDTEEAILFGIEEILALSRIGHKTIAQVAAYEVETQLIAIKAEQLRHRRDPGRKKRDMSFKRLVEAARDQIAQRDLGITQDVLFASEDSNSSFEMRRQHATTGLFNAAIEALNYLQDLGGLSDVQQRQLGALAEIALGVDALVLEKVYA